MVGYNLTRLISAIQDRGHEVLTIGGALPIRN